MARKPIRRLVAAIDRVQLERAARPLRRAPPVHHGGTCPRPTMREVPFPPKTAKCVIPLVPSRDAWRRGRLLRGDSSGRATVATEKTTALGSVARRGERPLFLWWPSRPDGSVAKEENRTTTETKRANQTYALKSAESRLPSRRADFLRQCELLDQQAASLIEETSLTEGEIFVELQAVHVRRTLAISEGSPS